MSGPAAGPSTDDESLTLREGRARYFARAGFDESGYTQRWVRLQAGPIPLFFPNTQSRVRAVRFHDLHHVLTGYDTSWTGEGEIAAFEIASGCADHQAAWVLNLLALAIGLAIAPRAMRTAFVRGRRARNLYRETFGESLLEERVGHARRRLGLAAPPAPTTPGERAAFGFWSAAAIGTFGAASAVFALLLASPFLWLR